VPEDETQEWVCCLERI